jgi:hypothetical protein
MHGRAAILRKQNRDQPMQFLWAFRYYPWRTHSAARFLPSKKRISHNTGCRRAGWLSYFLEFSLM